MIIYKFTEESFRLMDSITLYTTHCPVCKGVEMTLKKKNIAYTECTDINTLQNKGYTHPPVLEVDGVPYRGAEIYAYINKGVKKS